VTTRTILSRREAHAQGLKRFYTGEPCKHGHRCERFTSSGGCIECQTFKTPSKRHGFKGRNVGWPARGLVFSTQPTPEPEEMEAAFFYMEAMRWHDYAIQELRKNPELMLQYMKPKTHVEMAQLYNELEKDKRIRALARESLEKS
jgi:hypothetical protein